MTQPASVPVIGAEPEPEILSPEPEPCPDPPQPAEVRTGHRENLIIGQTADREKRVQLSAVPVIMY